MNAGPIYFLLIFLNTFLSAFASEKVILSFSGDLIIHEDLYKKVVQDKEHDFSKLWQKTFPLFEKADFSYVNLEGPTAVGITNKLKNKGDVGFVYDNEIYSGTDLLFNYHPSLIDALKKTGFDIVSTANNHSLDRGAIGIDLTIDELNKRNFYFFGTRKASSSDPLYKITPVKNFKIAWIACTEALNGFKDKKSQLLLCFEQKDELIKLIQQVNSEQKPDAIIVTPHWGHEYSHKPWAKQIALAREILEAGALAVVGAHPHVLQPMEKYVTSDKRNTYIFYSLGNFVAYQRNIERKSSAVVYLEFTKVNGKTSITDYYYEPTTRSRQEFFPARNMKDVVKHVEKYLGPLQQLRP
jgi:hypothetical protein